MAVLILCIFAVVGSLPFSVAQCDTAAGWQEFNGFCYRATQSTIGENVAWRDARSLCGLENADLASISTQAAQDFLVQVLDASTSSLHKFWIGYNSLESKGDQFSWTDGSLPVFTAWAFGEPDTEHDVQMCVYADRDNQGLWYTENCGYSREMALVCKHPVDDVAPPVSPTSLLPSYCPEGYVDVGNKCYRVFFNTGPTDNGSTWYQAKDFCRSQPGHYPDLASIHSAEDNAAITALLTDFSWALWIGYYLDSQHNLWMWSDQSVPGYENWGDLPQHITDYCIEMMVNPEPAGVWYSLSCGDRRGFICQTYKDPDALITTPPPTSPHSCPTGWTPYWYGCYMQRTQPNTWQEAENDCVLQGGHLASVGASAENAALFTGADGDIPMWLGMRRSFDGESFVWSDDFPDLYRNFGSGFPGSDDCVIMNSDETWEDTACSFIYPYMCKLTQGPPVTTPVYVEGECPGENWREWGQFCYLAVFSFSQFDVAEQACVQEGGHLASIHSYQENELVNELLQNAASSGGNGWIGLYKETTDDGPYMWTDGTPFDYDLWGMGEPNNPLTENCVYQYFSADILNLAKLWNNAPCNEQGSYICKYDKGPASNVSMVQPQYFVELNQTFSSSTGEDFTPACVQAYATQMNGNTQMMQAQVNGLIGGELCNGVTEEMMRILLTSSPMIITGNVGSTSPLFFIKTDRDMSLGLVHSCVSEIATYLSPYANWGSGSVLNPEPGCPEVMFAGQSFNTSDNAFVCVGGSSNNFMDNSINEAFLNYGVSHIGTFVTETGEDLTIQCLNDYNREFAVAALSKASEVNDLTQAGTLCSGLDVRINSISPLFLTANGDQGTTSQRYLLQAGSELTFSQFAACGEELSLYLGDHGNWADPIIPVPSGCPAIRFTPQMFRETQQEWICDQGDTYRAQDGVEQTLKVELKSPETGKAKPDQKDDADIADDLEKPTGRIIKSKKQEHLDKNQGKQKMDIEDPTHSKKMKKYHLKKKKKQLQKLMENMLLKHQKRR